MASSSSATERWPDYSSWSRERLLGRVDLLEATLKERTDSHRSKQANKKSQSPPRRLRNPRVEREFNPAKYSTRLIALKFAYLGQRYNGLEYHPNNDTPLPTIEEKLWKALNKARLIFPTPNPEITENEPNWEGCEYSKCGRTDRGVSAFGQVVGIRVRSNRPLSKSERPKTGHNVPSSEGNGYSNTLELASQALNPELASDNGQSTPTSPISLGDEALAFHNICDEIPYCQVLNRLLPPDIRVLAWCPAPPLDFSARFSCRERRYKYFFTQPAFTPTVGFSGTRPGGRREGWLDIPAMKNAAKKFEGLHDFRNFCKVDPSKQIENFERRIYYADIEQLDSHNASASYMGDPTFSQYEDLNEGSKQRSVLDPTVQSLEPKVYAFTLHGSAFLWHQVRHMVSILFLIGQGLEPTSLVDDLLDIHKTPCKPQYEMADDAPLVLWDCMFPREGSGSREDAMEWHHVGDLVGIGKQGGIERRSGGKFGVGGVVDEMWKTWRGRKIDEVLTGALLNVVVRQSPNSVLDEATGDKGSQRVFLGGNGPRRVGRYVPVMQKPKMDSVEVVNAKYAKRKGLFERGKEVSELQKEEIKEKGFRTVRC